MDGKPLIFGLTGGIASGKSTVAAFMQHSNVGVIDADRAAREVVEPGTQGLAELVAVFGTGVLAADGRLDRKAVAALVFADQAARQRLNSILHPLIRRVSMQRAQELAAQGKRAIAYEAALLIEEGHADTFRPLVLVVVDEASQIARLMARDSMTEQQALARVKSQMPLRDKLPFADHVIDTSGTPEQTRAETHRVLRLICKQAGIDPAPTLFE